MTLVLGYARVSTSKQADHGHSLEVQAQALRAEAMRHGWELDLIMEEGSARTLSKRPRLLEALGRLERREADALIVHRLDRLGRSLQDVLQIVSNADRQGWRVIFIEQGIDSSTTTGRLTLRLLAVLAEHDNELRSERIREGLAEARAKGVRLGRPLELSEETAATAAAARLSGMTYQATADTMREAGLATARGGEWTRSTVWKALHCRGLA